MAELPKRPDFVGIEEKWQRWWEEKGIYRFDPSSSKPIYSIDTPPPYASREHLHVGHALHYTQFEIISRFWRMNGYQVYFPPGFDDNGLPTEKYVEEVHKIDKKSVDRETFRELCRREAEKVEKEYADKYFRRLGHAYDWGLLYTTISDRAQRVAQLSFIDLYRKGLVYRAEEPTLWCPKHQTALAQAEVEDRERQTELHHILFEVLDGKGEDQITIATTRPELLPSCVGVFVHPNDQRFKDLIGRTAIVPIFNREVPIMADERVDPSFGSGIVMVCTFGDTTDIEWWKTHKLKLAISITPDGCLNHRAGKYEGLTIPEARKKIVRDLEERGLLVRSEPLTQTVGCCWRCGTPLEYIVTPQWFIKTLQHKEALIEQGRKIKWYPPYYRKRFEDWVRNLSWDWVISRQRYYGVPIPVWYCKKCGREVVASEEQLPVDPIVDKPRSPCECGSEEFKPDEDVFDTWMTSSMTPQIACKWLENPELYKRLFPMSLRPQSHDIIRTWAFYTILKSYLHFGSIPWKEIMIGTYVLDPQGRGMHKSKGNAIWLEDLLKKYNVDAIRYWVGTASVGEDLPFQEKEIRRGTRVLTKLWNASRFLCLNLDSDSKLEKPPRLEVVDRWILSKLARTTKEYKSFFRRYEISKARKSLEMFFMHDFADNYLEMVKHRIYGGNGESRTAALWTLYQVLLGIVKLFAPFIPHLTEEIYQTIFRAREKVESVHLTTFPVEAEPDQEAEQLGELGKEIVAALRQHKTKKRLSLGKKLEHVTISHPKPEQVEKLRGTIMGMLRIEKLDIIQGPFSISD